MDEQQQVFWTDINLRHKNICPKKKKKKQSTQTELFGYVKKAKYRFSKVPILHGEQQQKKMAKEFEIGISFISFTDDHSCR